MIIDSPIISGSSSATGSLNQVGIVSITGSLFVNGLAVTGNTGSAESASYAGAYTLTSSFQNYTSSTDARIASINASTASLNSYTSSTDAKIASINAFSASILNYTSSTDANITALYAFSSSLLSYTSSNNANITSLNSYTSSATARFVGLETATASFSGRIDGLELATASLNTYTSSATARFVGLETVTSSLNSFTSSANTRLGTLEAATASLNNYTSSATARFVGLETATSSLNAFTSSATARFVGLEAATASLNSYTSSNTANIVSLNSYTSSATARFVGLEAATASLYTATASFSGRVGGLEAATSSLNTFTSSINSRVTVVESKYATTGSNTFTGCQYISNTTAPTGFSNTTAAVYTDGGLQVTKDSYFSSSLYIKGDLIVYGTQSVSYITSSTLNISTNIISVNTATPSVRYGGLAVYDSGSTGLTGSLLWDSQNNHWLYSNPSGSSYSGGMLISGPRNTGSLGNEQGTTSCALMMGQGGDHITSSAIFHYGNATCFYGNSFISSSGAACFASSVTSLSNNFIATTNAYTTQGTVSYNDTRGLISRAKTATVYDFAVYSAAENAMIVNPTGTNTISFLSGDVGIGTSTIFYASTNRRVLEINGVSSSFLAFKTGDTAKSYIFQNGTDLIITNLAAAGGYLALENNGAERMRIAATGITCFSCQICAPVSVVTGASIVSGCLGVGTVTPRTKAEFSSGLPTSIPTYTNTTNGIVVSDGGDIYGRIGVSNFSAGGNGYPTYIQAGDYSGAIYYNLLLNPLGGSVGIGTTAPTSKLQVIVPESAGGLTGVTIVGSTNSKVLALGANATYAYVQSHGSVPLYINELGNNVIINSGGGNVGIGTTSPIRKLDIVTTGEQLRLAYDTSGTVYSDFRNDSAGGLLINTSGGYIVNYIGGSAKMRINPDSICFACQICAPQLCSTYIGASCFLEGPLKLGYRGCYVTAPAAIPYIYYSERFPNDASGAFPFNQYGELIFQASNRVGYNSGFSFATGTADIGNTATVSVKARIFESGVACFACQVCTPRLHINTPDGCGLTLQYGANSGYAGISTDSANSLIFKAYIGTEYMRISCAGNVGINCTSPNRALTVNGCIGMPNTYNWSVANDNDINWGFRVCSSSGNFATFLSYADDAGSDRRGGIFNTGGHWVAYGNCRGHFVVTCNLGVGTTSPSTTLTVKSTNDNGYALTRPSDATSLHWRLSTTETGGDAYTTRYNTFNNEMLFTTYAAGGTGGNIIWRTSASGGSGSEVERMRITSGGRVGIGLTSPTAFLHVCGNNCGADISCGGGNPDARGIIHAQLSNSAQSTNASVTVENDAGIGQFMQWTSFGMRIGSRIIKSTNCGHLHFTVGQDSNTVTFHCGGPACFANHICVGGNIIPISNGSQDLGSSSLRWCTVYTSDLSLNNGIGNYTIVEGENDLFLYNNNSCKVFKFVVQEVCPEIAPAKRST